MDIKFLDKVYSQILSETRIIGGKIHTPFSPTSLSSSILFSLHLSFLLSSHSKHCKEVYCLNKEETEYVWKKYKEGVTTLINDKDISHQEKG